ncbi:MAG: hypothetical protein WHT47_04740 [Hydrogenothermaceae bacterium]
MIFLLRLILIIPLIYTCYANGVEFSQEDRDRIIRLEENQRYLQKQIDDTKSEIKNLRDEIKELRADIKNSEDSLKTFILWGFGILFSGMGILIGFVLWDRRTAVEPVSKKVKELEEREDKIEKVLKELAKKDPKMQEILKEIGF